MMNNFSVLYFCFIILLAHILAPQDYNWKNNTISDLAAQGYVRKWLMQLGFIGFGFLLTLGILINWINEGSANYMNDIAIFLYGGSVLSSGFFCAEPFQMVASYDKKEARIHSFFAQLAGFTFSCGILLHFIYAKVVGLKLIHFIFFVIIIITSLTFGMSKKNQGVIQKILYIESFIWIIFWYGVI